MPAAFTPIQKLLIVLLLGGVLGAGALLIANVQGDTQIGLSLSPATLGDGLVAHWTFDGKDMDQNVGDASGAGEPLYLLDRPSRAPTTTIPGIIGQAFRLSGDDRHYIGATSTTYKFTSGDLSWGIWFRAQEINVSGLSEGILGWDAGTVGGWEVGADLLGTQANRCVMDLDGTDATAQWDAVANTLRVGEWHHYFCTWNDTSKTVRLYVDGVLRAEHTGAGNISYAGFGQQGILIGSDLQANAVWKGDFDDARIYRRQLTAQEVKLLYDMGNTTKVATTPPSPTSGAGGPDIGRGLVGHWSFDGKDLISNVRDISGFGNHGTYATGTGGYLSTTTTRGPVGQALSFKEKGGGGAFDGNMVDVPYHASLAISDSGGAFAGWIRSTAYPGAARSNTIVYKLNHGNLANTDGLYLQANQPNATPALYLEAEIIFDGTTNTLRPQTAADVLPLNTWFHGVMTYDANLIYLYRNGVLIGTTTKTASIVYDENKGLFLGRDAAVGGVHFGMNGDLDDVRVYNRTLSAEEVKAIYDIGATTKIGVAPTAPRLDGAGSGLVVHWTFDGKNMQTGTVIDSSGSGNHGTRFGQATSTAIARGMIGQALNFDRANDEVKTSGINMKNWGSLTAAAWVKYDSSGSPEHTILSNWDGAARPGILLRLEPTDDTVEAFVTVEPNTDLGGSFTDLVLTPNKWHHVAMRYDSAGGGLSAYLDGVRSSTVYSSSALLDADDTLASFFIGVSTPEHGASSDDYGGSMDDVRIYSRALSPDEIKQLYQMGQ